MPNLLLGLCEMDGGGEAIVDVLNGVMYHRNKPLTYEGQSSGAYDEGEPSGISSAKFAAKDEIEYLSCIFKKFTQISEEEDVDISLNITEKEMRKLTEKEGSKTDKQTTENSKAVCYRQGSYSQQNHIKSGIFHSEAIRNSYD
ncbi:Uncharacterized protein Fot_28234 [Forsythia ovata]|uniref:Uncharacterized protein n=1 Tax=Forsythia ovata TaxID=205694 RepID=A0ABD1TNY3_9LAMI